VGRSRFEDGRVHESVFALEAHASSFAYGQRMRLGPYISWPSSDQFDQPTARALDRCGMDRWVWIFVERQLLFNKDKFERGQCFSAAVAGLICSCENVTDFKVQLLLDLILRPSGSVALGLSMTVLLPKNPHSNPLVPLKNATNQPLQAPGCMSHTDIGRENHRCAQECHRWTHTGDQRRSSDLVPACSNFTVLNSVSTI
jgi:hypothetical protein